MLGKQSNVSDRIGTKNDLEHPETKALTSFLHNLFKLNKNKHFVFRKPTRELLVCFVYSLVPRISNLFIQNKSFFYHQFF